MQALRAEGVPYVVAPYEADAQLAYLERIGLVDGIITEDSDLLVFGCKNVLFKFDIHILPPLALVRFTPMHVNTGRLIDFCDVQLWLANFIDRSNIGNAKYVLACGCR